MRHALPALVLLLSVTCALFVGLWWNASTELRHLRQEVRYSHDAPFEEQAYRVAAAEEHASITKMREYFRPITMTYNRHRCVELRPRWNVKGGHTIYCFDKNTRALISKEQVPG